jgi:zinc transport system substrate-binding protein
VLLLPSGATPHAHALRPSEAALLQEADVIFQVGAGLETFLDRALEVLAAHARLISMAELPGVRLLSPRPPGVSTIPPMPRIRPAPAEGPIDAHLWMDPENARVFVAAAAHALAEIDPSNAARYAQNASVADLRLRELNRAIEEKLAPVRDRAFFTLHDAFAYFESRYALAGLGAIAISPERRPGAEGLRHIRLAVEAARPECVFTEPGASDDLISVVTEGLPIRVGVLDPMETAKEPGPELYFSAMSSNAEALYACLIGDPPGRE